MRWTLVLTLTESSREREEPSSLIRAQGQKDKGKLVLLLTRFLKKVLNKTLRKARLSQKSMHLLK